MLLLAVDYLDDLYFTSRHIDKFNIGLREEDADLFPEFANRVDAWRRKTPDEEVEKLIAKHGTLNAVLRHQISGGAL